MHAVAREENGGAPLTISLVVTPAPGAYFPGASLSSGDFVSGYTVPGLRASATGEVCVGAQCEKFDSAQSYHDHNWGIWRDVTWDWGAARAGSYTILYGRVIGPQRLGERTPLLVYLVDSLGFRSVFRPKTVSYEDNRQIVVDGRTLRVPSRATFADIRDDDTLRVELNIEDAIGTDTRRQPLGSSQGSFNAERPYFIQMKGTAHVSGRVGGAPINGTGTGFFETYR